jgi:polynucleotide 5'-kinase involved in rRNA processing
MDSDLILVFNTPAGGGISQGQLVYAKVKSRRTRSLHVRIENGSKMAAKGPIRIEVLEGRVSTRGVQFDSDSEPLIVRAWESFILEALEDSQISTTGNGTLTETDQDYPPQWKDFICRCSGNITAIIAGQADTGKSTLCSLIINALVSDGVVHVVDGDLGQSDIGPPTTVGLGSADEQILRLSECQLTDAFFVGDISPTTCIDVVVDATGSMVRAAGGNGGPVIVDTCGLVTGKLGEHLTDLVVDAAEPDVLALLEIEDELDYLVDRADQVFRLPSLPSNEKKAKARRWFRKSRFLSSLDRARIVRYDLSEVEVSGFMSKCSRVPSDIDSPLLSGSIDLRDLTKLEGALVGLQKGNRYRGIGVIKHVDCNRNMVAVTTACESEIDNMTVGNLRISEEGERRILSI